ncbi:N-acetylneuraminate synthase family protein [Paeniroseomonas aquatica]|uniref:N-acetylneuraminate synthase family protein n=1 Tax=Paeniroseomonas aquatica TaxID=373043 RepID=UPI00338F0D52
MHPRPEHAELQACCAEQGIASSTSVWDLTSALQMAALRPAFLKIPSATNLHAGCRTGSAATTPASCMSRPA